ncbi:MAG TPA: hypothetical protein VMU96_00530 [Casimicrobiaceae bacterium]|nr:hypothetical protein [Casimicrobiaceae bacterium]HVO86945.1 hypothetical protein [Casimicrobiaceae bacterium]
MSLKTEAKFTSRRTFLVKLHSAAKRGAMTGRVENFVTGRQYEFASSDELIASILNDLDWNEAAPIGKRDEG